MSVLTNTRNRVFSWLASNLREYGGLVESAPLLASIGGGAGVNGDVVSADSKRLIEILIRSVYAENKFAYRKLESIGWLTECDQWPTRFNPIPTVIAFYMANTLPEIAIKIDAETDATDSSAERQNPRADALAAALQIVRDSAEFDGLTASIVKDAATVSHCFIKAEAKYNAAGDVVSVYPKRIPPQTVRAFELDEQGHLTAIRIDTPMMKTMSGERDKHMRVEIWRRDYEDDNGVAVGGVRVYEVAAASYRALQGLSNSNAVSAENTDPYDLDGELPIVTHSLAELAIDFIPFAYAETPMGWWDMVDQIDEVNHLHFKASHNNLPTVIVTQSGFDSSGRPNPAVNVNGMGDRLGRSDGGNRRGYGETNVRSYGLSHVHENEGVRVFSLPGGGDANVMPPLVDLNGVNAQIEQIEQRVIGSLPEYTLENATTFAQIAADTIEKLQGNARDRVEAVRKQLHAALYRTMKMCLHIGQVNQLEAFSAETIGTMRNGDFAFKLSSPPVFAAMASQIVETAATLVRAAGAPLDFSLELAGLTDRELLDKLEESLARQAVRQRMATAAALGQISAGVDVTGVRPEV